MKLKNWKKYFAESILIVFSVLLALLLNQYMEARKINREVIKAKQGIITELERNKSIINTWSNKHGEIKQRLDQLVNSANDSLRNIIWLNNKFNLGALTDNQSLVDASLSNTAWETVKATQIINEFDFETVQMLTAVYSLQEILLSKTLN